VVVGGLERLLATVGRPFADVRALLDGYAGVAGAARGAAPRRARGCWRAPPTEAAPAVRSARAPAEPAARPPRRGDARRGARRARRIDRRRRLLDAPIEGRRVDLGAQAARKLAEVGLATLRDVLQHAPRRWEDRRALPSFAAAAGLERATVVGTVVGRKLVPTRRGGGVLRVVLEDARGERLTAVWFHQPWVEKQVFPRQRLIVTGRVKRRGRSLELHVEGFEVDDEGPSLSTGRIVAVYPSTQGLARRTCAGRSTARCGRCRARRPLPARLRADLDLVDRDRAWRDVHQPPDEAALQRALRRLKFDEFLLLELRLLLQRDGGAGRAYPTDRGRRRDLRRAPAVRAHRRPGARARRDPRRPRAPAPDGAAADGRRRQRQDGGRGRRGVDGGARGRPGRGDGADRAAGAPAPGVVHRAAVAAWACGSTCWSAAWRRASATRRARGCGGATDVVVGTHALIQEGVAFRDLGLAVIDEEHRFGVEQRRKLIRGSAGDVLVMTATPIPRSLALTVYGDLDVSVLDELPPGRTPIATRLVRAAQRRPCTASCGATSRAGTRRTWSRRWSRTPRRSTRSCRPPRCSTTCARCCRPRRGSGCCTAARAAARRTPSCAPSATTSSTSWCHDRRRGRRRRAERHRHGGRERRALRARAAAPAARAGGARRRTPGRCVLVAGEASRATMERLRVVEKHTDGFLIAERDLEPARSRASCAACGSRVCPTSPSATSRRRR
jgi:ATP-dependent DNA helicase RecG